MILKKEVWISPYKCNRTLHIYVPEQCSIKNPASVLYMFDGHNLFFDEDATYGKCWGLKEFCEKENPNLIIVGLECNHEGNERLCEFSPYDFYDKPWGQIRQRGRDLAKWMATELKPWIDEQFYTKKDRMNTYIGGSSMGGLMSLYILMNYSDVFSKAACLSPHLYPMFHQFYKDIPEFIHKDSTFYISWGGKEFSRPTQFARITDQNLQIVSALMKKEGVRVFPHVYAKGSHCEASWEKELPIIFDDLQIK